jgi:hypothetical protein
MVASQPSSTANPSYYKYKLGIEYNGSPMPDEFLAQVREVRVEESLYQPSRFTIILDNPFGPGYESGTPGKYTNDFKPGENWGVYFRTSMAEPEPFQNPFGGRVIYGAATRIEGEFNTRTQGPIKIIGHDELYLFNEGMHSRTFRNMTHSEIVTRLARDVGITLGEIDDTGFVDEYVFQANETNMQLLRKLAALNGFELFVQCDDQGDPLLHFRRPRPKDRLELTWGENVRNIRPHYVKLPVDYVQVPYWKYKEKRVDEIIQPRVSGTTSTQTGWSSQDPSSANASGVLRVPGVWHSATPEKIKQIAQSLCNEYQGQFMSAKVEAEGNADIRPGRVVHVPKNQKGEIGNFVGDYYVTETSHHYVDGVLTTRFTISDTGGYSMLANNLSSENQLKPGQTNLVGVVTDNKDPDNMGRVKVKFPTLNDQESFWARMTTIGGGNNRGFDCLPEINDEVMVAFEHGDIHRPYIIGSVWNGLDAPPEHVDRSVRNGKVELRTFRTRVGHQIQFADDDVSGREQGVYIETVDNFKVHLNDTKKEILVETADRFKVNLSDNRKEILIQTPGGMTIRLSDRDQSIELRAGGGGHIRLDRRGVSING